jgi:lipoyl synthase
VRSTCPDWLTLPARDYAPTARMAAVVAEYDLHTVCASADCPNAGECFARGTCTFMILGSTCTRHCRFCAVHRGRPAPPDRGEPARVAEAARVLGLRHVVVTSVTRDDLPDGGAEHFVATVRELRTRSGVTVELLVPDFGGSIGALEQVLSAEPDVLAHNVETVPRLYAAVRPEASYERSLALLARAGRSGECTTKSGLMLGLGETLQEVREVLVDLRAIGCDVVTMGQYLRPSDDRLPVVDYVAPPAFAALKRQADALGFRACMAGPLVRSSYHAEETVGARPAGRSGRP